MSNRQLWRRARAGEIPGAVQTKGGSWYLPAGVEVERKRQRITAQTRARIRQALIEGKEPAVIAYREGISPDSVYSVRKDLHNELVEEKRRHQERREHLEQMMKENPPELAGIHMQGGTYIKAIDVNENREELAALVQLGEGAYLDLLRHVLYVSPEKLAEIAAREDEHYQSLEALYKDTPEELRRHMGPA